MSKAIYLSWNKGLWAKEYVHFFHKTIESKQNICFSKILPLKLAIERFVYKLLAVKSRARETKIRICAHLTVKRFTIE